MEVDLSEGHNLVRLLMWAWEGGVCAFVGCGIAEVLCKIELNWAAVAE